MALKTRPYISDYLRSSPRPKVGSRWVWEIDAPLGRVLIEVADVRWNGEQWWVLGRTLPEAPTPMLATPSAEPREYWNELSRFWEACSFVVT